MRRRIAVDFALDHNQGDPVADTTTEVKTVSTTLEEEVRRETWLDQLHEMYVFFRNHPELIPESGVDVTRFEPVDTHQAREAAANLGPMEVARLWLDQEVVLQSDHFAPHVLQIFAHKEGISAEAQEQRTVAVTTWDPEIVKAGPLD